MNRSQAKGYILEELIKEILKKQGYQEIPSNIQNYYNVQNIGGDLKIKGRGAMHQIDALGQFGYQIPFVYPIRLLCEAKCLNKPVGIEIIRNFVGVLKDVSENYFIEKFGELDYKQRGRFTDVATIFSASSFSSDAQTYAYAQGIFLVSCTSLLADMNSIYDNLTRDGLTLTKQNIRDYFIRSHLGENLEKIYFANIMGSYPILIKSNSHFPKGRFNETDRAYITLTRELVPRVEPLKFKFIIHLGESWIGEFEIPEYILSKLSDKFDSEAFLDIKENYVNDIEIPMIIRGVKRIISLELDHDWIESARRRLRSSASH